MDVDMRARLVQKAYLATPEYQATMKRKRFDKRVDQGKKPPERVRRVQDGRPPF